MQLVKEHFPRDAVLNFERIQTFAEQEYRETTPEFDSPFDPEEFPNATEEMREWVRETLSLPRPNPMVN